MGDAMYAFNPPPGWPIPKGWVPPKDWRPPPDWPNPPFGWSFWTWVDEPDAPGPELPPPDWNPPETVRPEPTKASRGRLGSVIGGVVAVVGVLVGLLAWLNPDPGSQLSTAEERRPYIAQVDAMCVDVGKVNRQMTEPKNTEQYAQVTETLAAAYQKLLGEWSALSLPRETDTAELRPTLDALEAMVFSMREVAEWMRLGDVQQAGDEFERLREHATEFRRLSRGYGFAQCPQIGVIP